MRLPTGSNQRHTHTHTHAHRHRLTSVQSTEDVVQLQKQVRIVIEGEKTTWPESREFRRGSQAEEEERGGATRLHRPMVKVSEWHVRD